MAEEAGTGGRRPPRAARLGEVAGALALLAATGLLLGGPLRGAAAGTALVAARGGPAGVVQLHFVAASDTPADQRLKQEVVRALLPVIVRELSPAGLPAGGRGSEVLLERARQRSGEWARLARQVLRRAGSREGVEVVVGRYTYPAKRSGSLWLPAGVYPSVEVRLGPARGHNWWCLLFPQLCLPLAGDLPAGGASPAAPVRGDGTAVAALAPAEPVTAGGTGDVQLAFRLDDGAATGGEERPRFRLALWEWLRGVEPRLARAVERSRFLIAEP
ncbi:MAG: stage II sporulation protein R [Clostridia bacterium]|nr:stage II sporulation protein R [Clostridia bacterium]